MKPTKHLVGTKIGTKAMQQKKHIPSHAEIMTMIEQARQYRLEAQAATARQLAVLDIIEAAYGPDIPGLPEQAKVAE
jgi:hypothetical protein